MSAFLITRHGGSGTRQEIQIGDSCPLLMMASEGISAFLDKYSDLWGEVVIAFGGVSAKDFPGSALDLFIGHEMYWNILFQQ